MSSEESEYYRTRAAQERAAADEATQADVAAVHLELAKHYDKLIRESQLEFRKAG